MPRPADQRPDAADLLQLESLCDEFEASWREGSAPRLEAFLARAPAAMQERLLRELLPLEWDYRRARGETPTHEEYRRRFPQFAATLEQALAVPSAADTSGAAALEDTQPGSPGGGFASSTPRRLGEYELLRVLGRGGMGVVYQAFHRRLQRMVAIKMLPNEQWSNPAAIARFEREMAAIGQLSHPHIVAAHDAGEVDGAHYLVMEFVDGVDLAALLDRLGPLPIAEASDLVRQAAVALQYAHEQGLVHRDVKPSNLMLTREGVLKVLDLGLARLKFGGIETPNDVTAAGQLMGTFDYMAPEQVDDSHGVDIRADIYSLGATFYKLLAGQAPLAHERPSSLTDRLRVLAESPPAPIESYRSDVPPAIAEVLRRCLAKHRDERFSTPAELAAALAKTAADGDVRRLFGPEMANQAPLTPTATRRNGPSAGRSFARGLRRSTWTMLLATLGVAAVLVVAYVNWPKKPAEEAPLQNLVRVERAGKLYVEDQFPAALPVRGGDELRIVADLPSGMRPSVWAVDSDGQVHNFTDFEVRTTATGSRVTYPARGQTLPVDDHVGTELIIVLGHAADQPAIDWVRAAIVEVFQGRPLPTGLPHQALVIADRDRVQLRTVTGDVARGFGEPRHNALHQLEDQIDQLRKRMREQCLFLAIVVFPHEL